MISTKCSRCSINTPQRLKFEGLICEPAFKGTDIKRLLLIERSNSGHQSVKKRTKDFDCQTCLVIGAKDACTSTDDLEYFAEEYGEEEAYLLDEAMALQNPNFVPPVNLNPFTNPFYEILAFDDPLDYLWDTELDGERVCAEWILKHQKSIIHYYKSIIYDDDLCVHIILTCDNDLCGHIILICDDEFCGQIILTCGNDLCGHIILICDDDVCGHIILTCDRDLCGHIILTCDRDLCGHIILTCDRDLCGQIILN
ncbi:hypothetical protein CDAR_492051 [Caerostris darwini]|uniref:Uncharacterized protein n=1 Tax=Caerostris darwini TaxID=1538125 RepID=A0AAV4VL04_9ARAC|nr:hypothetical protein CDAR_492051 [Caerostris darwini]